MVFDYHRSFIYSLNFNINIKLYIKPYTWNINTEWLKWVRLAVGFMEPRWRWEAELVEMHRIVVFR